MYKVIDEKKGFQRISFLDLETENTALQRFQNVPWQASIITQVGNKIVKELDFYIKWDEKTLGRKFCISRGAAAVTRYNPETIEKYGRPPEEVYDALLPELEAADYICGHNLLMFDACVWQEFAEAIKRPIYNIVPKIIDTAAVYKGMKLEQSPKNQSDFTAWQYRVMHTRKKGLRFSLELIGKEYKVEHDYTTLHNSLSDLHLNAKVFQHLKYAIKM
jgi:hypothetical protein